MPALKLLSVKYLDAFGKRGNPVQMKELRYSGEAFFVEDQVAEALDRFDAALSDSGITADIVLRLGGGKASVQFELGRDLASGNTLHARPAEGDGSHLGLDEI
jgi:hypothetical protein